MSTLDRTIAPVFHEITEIKLPTIETSILENGIQVHYLNAGSQDVVKVELIFEAGVWQQPAPLISSLTNAMLLEGTSNYSSAQLSEKIDFYGAYLHPQIDKDSASITLYTLTKYLPETIGIIKDVINYSVFPENEFETLVSKRRQQFIVDSDKVKVLAARKFQEVIFGTNSPYGVSAKIEDFKKVNSHKLHEFFYHHYSSKNCKIIVAGKITEKVKSIITDEFSNSFGNQALTSANNSVGVASSNEKQSYVAKSAAVQSAIRVGKPMINKKHPDYARLKVLNTVLGGYFGSRLMNNIREDKGYTYGINSLLISLKNSGYFTVATEVGSEFGEQTLTEIKKEMQLLNDQLIPQEELNRVRSYMMGELLRNVDGPFSASESYRSLIEFDLDFSFITEMASTIRRTKADQLISLAQDYLNPDSMYYVVAGPEKE